MPPTTAQIERYQKWEKVTTPWLTALAVVSLVTFVISGATEKRDDFIYTLDYAIWGVFVVDYLTRLWLSPRRWLFIRTHPMDLAAVILPEVRVLRLIGIIGRVGMLAHRGRSETLLLTTAMLAVTIVAASAAAVLGPERNAPDANITDYGDAVWWAMTTITTVGYGDRFPVTAEGRSIGVVLMIVGIATMGMVTATIAARLVASGDEEYLAQEKRLEEGQQDKIAALETQVAELSALIKSHYGEPGGKK
jgi:voltage-gated potassium channel